MKTLKPVLCALSLKKADNGILFFLNIVINSKLVSTQYKTHIYNVSADN